MNPLPNTALEPLEAKPLPSVDELRARFDYDPETGALTRRVTSGRWKKGEAVGTAQRLGHIKVYIGSAGFYAHRIAWKMHYGAEPPPFIDHIDGNPANNRIANLREATWTQNQWNRRVRKGARSGLRGVSWSRGKWQAMIMIDGKQKWLGAFDDKHEAHRVWQDAARQHHGEFARLA